MIIKLGEYVDAMQDITEQYILLTELMLSNADLDYFNGMIELQDLAKELN